MLCRDRDRYQDMRSWSYRPALPDSAVTHMEKNILKGTPVLESTVNIAEVDKVQRFIIWKWTSKIYMLKISSLTGLESCNHNCLSNNVCKTELTVCKLFIFYPLHILTSYRQVEFAQLNWPGCLWAGLDAVTVKQRSFELTLPSGGQVMNMF